MRPQLGVAPAASTDAARYVDLAVRSILQSAIPFVLGPSGYMQNNGVVILGQRPASSATVTFSATSGSGVTATFSAAALGGTSALDTGRVLTILDTTYKFFTITGNSGSSTTVCQGTISGGTLSGVGAFANSALWLSNNSTGSVSGYGTPLPRVVGNCYAYFPAGAISSGSTAGWSWTNWSSTTVGQAYNNAYTAGQPAVVASPTAYATTGPGAYTQSAGTYIQGPTGTYTGNTMGVNGSIENMLFLSGPSNTNAKIAKPFLGSATTRYGSVSVATSSPTGGGVVSLTNQGVATSQIYAGSAYGDFNMITGGAVSATTSFDTTANQSAGLALNSQIATDYEILERYAIRLYPTSP